MNLTQPFCTNKSLIGQNLYRLKQVDVNDATTYSKTVLIRYGQPGRATNYACA